MLWFKALAKAVVLPPLPLLALIAAGIVLSGRARRAGLSLALTALTALTALSMPVVAAMLVRLIDAAPPFDAAKAQGAQAIVVFGGGTRRNAPEYGGDTLAILTLERVRYAARVARSTGLPVLVSGGSLFGARAEATLMRECLVDEFGVEVRWSEEASRNTHENAVLSAAMLRADGVSRVILVMHSFDMRRARAELADAGIESIPAPTRIPGSTGTLYDWLPSAAGFAAFSSDGPTLAGVTQFSPISA